MSLIVFHPQAVAFVGHLGAVDTHRHAAPAIVVGLSKSIEFLAKGQDALVAPGAMISPGAHHELHAADQEVLTLYLEPGSDWARAVMHACGSSIFAPIIESRPWRSLAHALIDAPSDVSACTSALTVALEALLMTSNAARTDTRIKHALEHCRRGMEDDETLLARRLCLSGSRLRHLFVADTGTTLSRYRLWCRIRRAVSSALAGKSLTVAAVEAGFFDSAHFSRSFREMFGVSPSAILAREGLICVAPNELLPMNKAFMSGHARFAEVRSASMAP